MEFNTPASWRSLVEPEVALPKLLLAVLNGAVAVWSRVVPDPTHPTSEIPHVPDALSGSDSGVCVSVYASVGV